MKIEQICIGKHIIAKDEQTDLAHVCKRHYYYCPCCLLVFPNQILMKTHFMQDFQCGHCKQIYCIQGMGEDFRKGDFGSAACKNCW